MIEVLLLVIAVSLLGLWRTVFIINKNQVKGMVYKYGGHQE